jgi:1,4-alpha-glucan branching enzyme
MASRPAGRTGACASLKQPRFMSDQKQGYLSIVLHAHLPFVRHPEHERFLEENWLFEAVTETYLPLLQKMEGWLHDGMPWQLTITLTPTLCSMLQDPLLQDRFVRYLDGLVELSEKEVHRTHWDRPYHDLARMYHERFLAFRDTYFGYDRDLIGAFRKFQDADHLEIITSAATHALLPLLASHPPSLRAQILVARDHYRTCFGRDPFGIWLPECAYAAGVDQVLQEAGIRWFITDTHGVLHARPRPRYGVFAPIFTPHGVAAFGRDLDSARQVWSKETGYPGDPRYRDFYRDIGYDLDLDYVKPYLPGEGGRSFTGIKYHAITGSEQEKKLYDRGLALQAAGDHSRHFLEERLKQVRTLAEIMDRPPIIVAPYDAELFGHWWYEGPEFLDYFMRQTAYDQKAIQATTPLSYLRENPTQQVATPSPSSWGEEGYYKVWLNETNEWIFPHLHIAQERMTHLVQRHPAASGLKRRALQQAARELLLAQSSDWPFILRTGTSPDYARKRVTDHLVRFIALHEQLTATHVNEFWLERIEAKDNIFPDVDPYYWA